MMNFKVYGLIVVAVAGLVAIPAASAAPPTGEQSAQRWRMAAWHHVTVGVKDLDSALAQWVGLMGFEVRSRQEGPDAGLASLWHIAPEDIERQAIIGTPGAELGLIHLVQFRDPDPPVREGAEVFDLLPKNLDIFAKNLPQRFEALRAAGATFRTDTYSDITTPSGGRFMEIHMHGHDATNVVLVETPGSERDLYTDKGFSGVVQLISIVPDANREKAFYEQVMGLDELSKSILTGPNVEKMVGLPTGSGLDVRIFGDGNVRFGLMEVVEYQGVEGRDRYPLAKPKALGTLHVSYLLDDLAPLRQRLSAFGTAFEENEGVTTVFGSGPALTFQIPAGLRIGAHQRQ
jgi:catechol 2,3-dioxygenase-like lactoylglutathione lyase family enzyme